MAAVTKTKLPDPLPSEADDDELFTTISGLAPKRTRIMLRLDRHPAGQVYELHHLADFDLLESQDLLRDGEEFDQLYNRRLAAKHDKARMKMILDRMFDKVLIADDDVKRECSDFVRTQVVTAFTVALLREAALTAQRPEMPMDADLTSDG